MTVGELLNTIDKTQPIRIYQRTITSEEVLVAIMTRGVAKARNVMELMTYITDFKVYYMNCDGHYINIFFQESGSPRLKIPDVFEAETEDEDSDWFDI